MSKSGRSPWATRFFAPQISLARVAWLRIAIYLFVPYDALVTFEDSLKHGSAPAELYRGLIVRSVLGMPAPSEMYVRGVLATVIISALIAATGRMPRLAGWVCAIAMLDWASNGFSYGKIDHDHFAFIVALFVLPSVGRAGVRDIDVVSRSAGWAVRTIQICAVASYTLAGWAKIRFGGWYWANGSTLIWALTRRPNGIGPWLGNQPMLTYLLQWTVLFAEILAPVMLFLRERALYCAVAFWLLFHLSTYLLLRIHFLPLLLCLLAFMPLERLWPWWRGLRQARS